jgi:hypothetical protein
LEQQYHRKFRFPRTLWDVVAMPSGGLQRYFGAGGCDESLTLRLQRLNKTRTASGDDGKRCQHLGGLKRLVVSRRASDINTVAWEHRCRRRNQHLRLLLGALRVGERGAC